MSENKHTPEPWSVDPDSTDYYASILDANGADTILLGDYVDWWMTKANARRIVACVNACAGAKTEDLEALGSDYIKVYAQTIKQRDELLEVLLTAAETFASYAEIHAAKTPPDIVKAEFNRDRAQMCFAAIASVKGEQ